MKHIFKLILIFAIITYTAAFGNQVDVNFNFTSSNDTLYGTIEIPNILDYPDLIYSSEIIFSYDPAMTTLDTINFDNSILEDWGGMIYSIDNTIGVCKLAGAGYTPISTQGEILSLMFSIHDPDVAVNPEMYIQLTKVMINEDLIFPVPTDVETNSFDIPERFTLHQNYPNPFNPYTVIEFSLARSADVSLSIYNVLGQIVKKVEYGLKAAGTYSYQWDATDITNNKVVSGVYFYRLEADNRTFTKKMILIK